MPGACRTIDLELQFTIFGTSTNETPIPPVGGGSNKVKRSLSEIEVLCF
jgi:hypothetical protein